MPIRSLTPHPITLRALNMTLKRVLALVASAASAVACSDSTGSRSETFMFAIQAPATVEAGSSVAISLQVANRGSAAAGLTFDSSQAFLPFLARSDGTILWQPRTGWTTILMKFPPRMFAPGEKVLLQDTIPGDVLTTGTYRVGGYVLADDRVVSLPTTTLTVVEAAPKR